MQESFLLLIGHFVLLYVGVPFLFGLFLINVIVLLQPSVKMLLVIFFIALIHVLITRAFIHACRYIISWDIDFCSYALFATFSVGCVIIFGLVLTILLNCCCWSCTLLLGFFFLILFLQIYSCMLEFSWSCIKILCLLGFCDWFSIAVYIFLNWHFP